MQTRKQNKTKQCLYIKKKKKKQTLKHLKNKKDISGFIRNYSCLDSLLLDCLPLKCSKIDEKKTKTKTYN